MNKGTSETYCSRGRSTTSGYNLATKGSSTISGYNINAPGNPSLINYIPSSLGGSFRAGPYDDCSDDDLEEIEKSSQTEVEKSVKFEDETLHHLWRNVRDLAGPWISHRFSLGEWESLDQSPDKSNAEKEREEIERDEAPYDGVLTKEVLAPNLSRVGRCPEYEHYAYTKCILSKKKLVNIDLLQKYHYLQYVDVSNNALTTLTALGNLPFLKILDASHNLLPTILDFYPPFFLTNVNLSYNKIRTMRNLRDFWSITDLNLAHNFIRRIDGIKELRYLTTLNLSFNRIGAVENLEGTRLQFLYLQNNFINTPEMEWNQAELHTLKNIRTINLSYNQVSSLQMFEAVENLECLELVHNNVSKLLDIYYLRNLNYLNKLNLTSNPVTEIQRYVEVCLTHLKMLSVLDGEQINSDFWLERFSYEKTDMSQMANHNRIRLLILEQLNPPKILPWLLPYDAAPIAVIVLVGLQASSRTHIARKYCKQNPNVILGIAHTTKAKHSNEKQDEVYHYVSEETFKSMLKKGEFFTYQENLGCYYGVAHTEFKKAEKGILLFCTDLTLAIVLKRKFINTVLVLSLASTRSAHLQRLSNLYAVKFVDSYTSKILTSPLVAAEYQLQFTKERERILEQEAHEVLEEMVKKVAKIYDNMMVQRRLETTKYRHTSNDDLLRCSQDETSLKLWWASSPKNSHRLSLMIQPIQAERGSKYSEKIDGQSKANLESAMNCVQMKRLVSFRVKSSIDSSDSPHKVPVSCAVIDKSVLKKPSKSKLKKDKNKKKATLAKMSEEQERTYLIAEAALRNHYTYAEALSRDDRMTNVFNAELRQREELLELHLQFPGFFRELLFTDQEEESLEKLDRLIKDIIKHDTITKETIMVPSANERFGIAIKRKISKAFDELKKELSITEKQSAEFPVRQLHFICMDDGICQLPSCPRW
ncbi:leucine-rich repeat and guanylate kinase domain-containing protein-like [Anthonomus grandis grandis]|uniref:leucine-rich repeat and guanylate kinase domain-containing protein-like n=1 Tax=Anthonomus grandis grandis TaxID=2921223 RepID=UPI0021665590|nr:leucine-rich repeat and guanylate kinase domain-containing protein-like [Anthonomus grandis grandis]